VWVSYLEDVLSNGVIITLLLVFGLLKFAMVAAWYMHLRTDQPIFRRFFVLGAVAAILLYLVVLLTLHVFE
jgi:xanthine/uracil permease